MFHIFFISKQHVCVLVSAPGFTTEGGWPRLAHVRFPCRASRGFAKMVDRIGVSYDMGNWGLNSNNLGFQVSASIKTLQICKRSCSQNKTLRWSCCMLLYSKLQMRFEPRGSNNVRPPGRLQLQRQLGRFRS